MILSFIASFSFWRVALDPMGLSVKTQTNFKNQNWSHSFICSSDELVMIYILI